MSLITPVTLRFIEFRSVEKAALPTTQVVMLTIHKDQVHRADAAAAGASAYVSKRTLHHDLAPVIDALI